MFTVEIEGLGSVTRDWNEALGALADGCTKGVERGVTEGAEQARASHPYHDRSGDLTRSIQGRLERSAARVAGGEASGVIVAGKRYASFVEGGTEPHDIEAKGKALRWEGADGEHFARRVHHPGSPALPFIGPAALKAERVIEVEVGLAEERAAEIMAR